MTRWPTVLTCYAFGSLRLKEAPVPLGGDRSSPDVIENPVGPHAVNCLPGQKRIFNDEQQQFVCENCGPYMTSHILGGVVGDCVPCEAGKSAVSGAPRCDFCPPGTASRVGSSCQPCGAGTYSALMGQSSCTECGPGQISIESQLSCTECPAGKFEVQKQNCKDCSAGTYAFTSGMTSCVPCGAGFFAAETGGTVCNPCQAGYFSIGGSVRCSACPKGYSSIPTSSECYSCAANKYASMSGSETCHPCPANMWSPQGSHRCFACDSQHCRMNKIGGPPVNTSNGESPAPPVE